MQLARERTELRHYFEIKSDLAAAVRDAAAEEIAFHLEELAIMQQHTTSDRLRHGCAATIAQHTNPADAATVSA